MHGGGAGPQRRPHDPLLRLHLRPGDEEDHEELEDDAGRDEHPDRPQVRERHDEVERHLSAGHRPDRRDDEDEVLVVGVAIERNPRVESLEPAIGWLLRLRHGRNNSRAAGCGPGSRLFGVAGLGLDDGFAHRGS